MARMTEDVKARLRTYAKKKRLCDITENDILVALDYASDSLPGFDRTTTPKRKGRVAFITRGPGFDDLLGKHLASISEPIRCRPHQDDNGQWRTSVVRRLYDRAALECVLQFLGLDLEKKRRWVKWRD